MNGKTHKWRGEKDWGGVLEKSRRRIGDWKRLVATHHVSHTVTVLLTIRYIRRYGTGRSKIDDGKMCRCMRKWCVSAIDENVLSAKEERWLRRKLGETVDGGNASGGMENTPPVPLERNECGNCKENKLWSDDERKRREWIGQKEGDKFSLQW